MDWIKEARENHQAIDELYKEVEEGAMLFLARIQEDGIFNDFMEMVDAEEYTDEYMVNSDNAVVADECSELGEFIKQIKQNLYELDEYLMEQAQKDTITDEEIWAVSYYVKSLMDLKDNQREREMLINSIEESNRSFNANSFNN